jgi:hypothetical protein
VKYNLVNTTSNPVTKPVKQTNQEKKHKRHAATGGKGELQRLPATNPTRTLPRQQTKAGHERSKIPKTTAQNQGPASKETAAPRLIKETQTSSDNQTGRALKH